MFNSSGRAYPLVLFSGLMLGVSGCARMNRQPAPPAPVDGTATFVYRLNADGAVDTLWQASRAGWIRWEGSGDVPGRGISLIIDHRSYPVRLLLADHRQQLVVEFTAREEQALLRELGGARASDRAVPVSLGHSRRSTAGGLTLATALRDHPLLGVMLGDEWSTLVSDGADGSGVTDAVVERDGEQVMSLSRVRWEPARVSDRSIDVPSTYRRLSVEEWIDREVVRIIAGALRALQRKEASRWKRSIP